jgi:hypothetical protein
VIFLLLHYAHLVALPVLDFEFSAPVLRSVCCRQYLVLPPGLLTPGWVNFSFLKFVLAARFTSARCFTACVTVSRRPIFLLGLTAHQSCRFSGALDLVLDCDCVFRLFGFLALQPVPVGFKPRQLVSGKFSLNIQESTFFYCVFLCGWLQFESR